MTGIPQFPFDRVVHLQRMAQQAKHLQQALEAAQTTENIGYIGPQAAPTNRTTLAVLGAAFALADSLHSQLDEWLSTP